MNRALWLRRGAAAGVVALGGLSLVSAAAIAGDVLAVRRAASDGEPSSAAAASRYRPLPGLKPILRPGAASPDIAIGEHLNGALGQSGLVVTSVRTASVRSLGGGLRLAEVRVEGRGALAAAGAVSRWVAVNREAVRLKELAAMTSPEGDGRVSFVLLMVIA